MIDIFVADTLHYTCTDISSKHREGSFQKNVLLNYMFLLEKSENQLLTEFYALLLTSIKYTLIDLNDRLHLV